MKALLDDRYDDVDRDGDPDLGLDRVLGSPEEGLYTEMLLDPFEEKLDLPAAFVERANRGGWKLEMVCQEDQCLPGLWVFEADTPEMLRVTVTGKRPSNAMVWSQMMPALRSLGAE
jgi:hypothetical protein